MNVEPNVTAWLHSEAPPRARPGLLDATLERVAVTPQARGLWKAGSSAGDRRSFRDWIGRGLPRGFVLVAMLALLAAALVGAALLGAQLLRLQRDSWHLGSLVYSAQGDIYVAAADGSSPVLIADGVSAEAAPSYLDPQWSPDGRHLMYWEGGAGVVHVADSDGRHIVSFPGWQSSWAPDSTRIATWAGEGVEVHAAQDGRLLASLPVAITMLSCCHDPSPPRWVPDGTAIMVEPDYWVLPIDGAPARRLFADDIVAELGRFASFSHDGRRLVGVSSSSLIVADADGTDRRVVGHELASNPIMSPTGTQVAYISTVARGSQATRDELRVVDLASGTDRAVAALPDQLLLLDISLVEWSPSGDRIMLIQTQTGVRPGASLFSVDIDTGAWDPLVEGAENAAWQWIPVDGVQ
jgi:hypothetical protein